MFYSFYKVPICLGIFFISLAGCQNNIRPQVDDFSNPAIFKDIPVTKSGRIDPYYEHVLERAKEYNLDVIEDGYDSLCIRLWYDYRYAFEVVQIRNKDHKWTAEFISVLPDKTLDDTYKTSRLANPKSGWNSFIKKIYSKEILTLKDMYSISFDITKMPMDGTSVHIEIATKNNYRLYSYTNHDCFPELREVRLLKEIISIIEQEFGIKQLDINALMERYDRAGKRIN